MSREKAKRGVLVRLVRENGALMIRMDDAAQTEICSDLWRRMELITKGDLDEAQLADMNFDDKQLADFAVAIIARLYAYKEMGEAP